MDLSREQEGRGLTNQESRLSALKEIRHGVKRGTVHLVQDGQGGVYLATKEGVAWIDLWGEPLMFVEDLGTPEQVVVKMQGLKHCLRLLENAKRQIDNIVELERSL